jgi:TolB protein
MMTRINHLGALTAAAGVLVAAGMLMLMMVALVKPAGAAFPGQNGKIAFTSTRDGNSEIYTMNTAGGALDRLTNNPAADFRPTWSPDGNKIAFQSTRDGNQEIYTMNTTGGALDRLTNNPQGDYAPAWSPDGNRIAFASNRDGNYEVYAMNSNGTGLDRLTNNPATDSRPNWSPDGNKITFRSDRDGNYEIYTMNTTGGALDRLTNNPQSDDNPAWSPDGNRIAFDSTRDGNLEIYAMNSTGAALDRLTNNPQNDDDPDWQPLKAAAPPPDTTPTTAAPTVLSTVPAADATGVSPTADITATFSKKMMASSINETTFFIKEQGSNTKLGAAVSYDAATDKATLNPTNSLQSGATYKAVVTTGATDVAGNSLDQDDTTAGLQRKKWLFTVS